MEEGREGAAPPVHSIGIPVGPLQLVGVFDAASIIDYSRAEILDG